MLHQITHSFQVVPSRSCPRSRQSHPDHAHFSGGPTQIMHTFQLVPPKSCQLSRRSHPDVYPPGGPTQIMFSLQVFPPRSCPLSRTTQSKSIFQVVPHISHPLYGWSHQNHVHFSWPSKDYSHFLRNFLLESNPLTNGIHT